MKKRGEGRFLCDETKRSCGDRRGKIATSGHRKHSFIHSSAGCARAILGREGIGQPEASACGVMPRQEEPSIAWSICWIAGFSRFSRTSGCVFFIDHKRKGPIAKDTFEDRPHLLP